MSRTTKRKFLYFILFTVGMAAFIIIDEQLHLPGWSVLAVVIILLIPGRIQGHFWRHFFRGRFQLDKQKFRPALEETMKFLEELHARPWIRKFSYLGFSIYTRDVEAMTYLNIGAAKLGLGELDEAEEAFQTAKSIDEFYPLPYFNLAILSAVRGQADDASELLRRARELGYSGATSDRMAHAVSGILARIEGSSKVENTV